MAHKDWHKGAVIYQIYPRSFLDTTGNGVGDLKGITQKLEYVASLGVDGIWISPFFKSPMKDFGYDVSDYRDIDPLFGTLADFDELLEKAHSLGLKIIVDLVLSHTSNEHPWFTDPAKKSWYVWADPKIDEQGNRAPPNNWASVFGGSAWEWSDEHNQYYLHNFLKEQPDLNFHNPEVQAEMLDICDFWLKRGIDGFRLDVINFCFHDKELRDNPPRESGSKYATQFEGDTPYSAQQHIYDKSQPENLEFIAKIRKITNQYGGRVLVGEIGDDHPYKLAQEYTASDKYLHTTYNPHMMSGVEKELTTDLIREPINAFFSDQALYESAKDSPENAMGWPSWAFSNHDVVRVASRWFKLYEHDPNLSKMLIALLGCLPGTVFLYQGEELGLPEAKIPFDSLQDPWAKETWPEWQGRDGCRTPMVWNGKKHSGFSGSKPWLPIPETHNTLDVQAQNIDKSSTLNFSRSFINWRKSKAEIVKGSFEFIDTNNSKIIDLRRYDGENETHCIFNLSDQNICYKNRDYPPFSYSIGDFEFDIKNTYSKEDFTIPHPQ